MASAELLAHYRAKPADERQMHRWLGFPDSSEPELFTRDRRPPEESGE